MLCQEIMKKNVEYLNPQDTAEAAGRKMRDTNVGFLPVCDRSGKVIGTVTDRDIAIRVVAQGKTASTAVESIMTREVVSCQPGDDIRRAEEVMSKNHKSRLLCIDNGKLVGVISLSDIAEKDAARAVQTINEVNRREIRS